MKDRAAQTAYIEKISASVAPVFKPALCDHIHCALFRKYPAKPPGIQDLEATLGDEYKGLLPLIAPAVPEGYQVVLAHQCSYAGRKFVHLTLRKGTDVISLVIARKNEGEGFGILTPETSTSGVPVYQASNGVLPGSGIRERALSGIRDQRLEGQGEPANRRLAGPVCTATAFVIGAPSLMIEEMSTIKSERIC